jgi:hypothetical protein
MMRRRKIVNGTVACAFAVSILLLAAILIAPKVVDSETVKAVDRPETCLLIWKSAPMESIWIS